MTGKWTVEGAEKDRQTINAQWTVAGMQLIDGVSVREVLHVPKSQGYLTEVARGAWLGENTLIDQIFQVVLPPRAISAWHAHGETTDRLFVSRGLFRIVLYDAREGSPTRGAINEFRFGTVRPALVIVPPRVWHGLQNVGEEEGIILNLVDRAYDYEDPDHWRVSADSPEIPFAF